MARRGVFFVVVLLAVASLGLECARADALDEMLNKAGPRVVEYLRQHGYKNVGVLRFRVQQGTRPASFQTGPINGNLVERLESALILHMGSDEKNAIGIIHDAGKEASLRRIADWYGNAGDRKKLFDITSYPLAWGDKRVKADAFLTGILKTSADYKKSTLTIESFTSGNSAKLEKVVEFSLDTDIPLLRDLGKSFSIAKRGSTGKLTSAMRRSAALGEVEDGEGVKPEDSGVVTIDGIEFKLMSGEEVVRVKKSGSESDGVKNEVECPSPEKPVSISIRNTTDKKLGVDVKLNGRSLLFEQTDESEKCRIWVLDPGKTYVLKGWYLNEESLKNVAPFKILVGDEARQMKETLGQKAGDIDVAVFEASDQSTTGEDMSVSRGLRGLPTQTAKQARRSFESLQKALKTASKQKTTTVTQTVNGSQVKREILVADTDEEKRANQKLTAVDFPNRKALGSLCIKIIPRKSGEESAP